MDRVLVYSKKDGSCGLIYPKDSFKQLWESEHSAIERLWEISIPEICEFIACRKQDILEDLTFREAWRKGDVNEPIKVDFPHAMGIHRQRLKSAADQKISQLEEKFQDAVQRQFLPEQVAIRSTINILGRIHEMDMTHCKTIDDIKWCIPKELYDVWTFYTIA